MTIAVSPSQDGSFLGGGRGESEGEPSGPLPQPPLQDEPLGEGASVAFAASAPNGAGVVAELLAQRLASRRRRAYLDKDRHQAFVAFAAGRLGAEAPLLPGWYALAARFVERATGQATGLMELGVVRAG